LRPVASSALAVFLQHAEDNASSLAKQPNRNDAAPLSARGGKQALETWYWEYWFEREHSPDLAILIARRLRSLFRWLIRGLCWSLTVEKTGDVGDARSTEVGRPWDTNAKPSKQLSVYRDQNGDIEITLARMVQPRS
jgi:hypothetical protein